MKTEMLLAVFAMSVTGAWPAWAESTSSTSPASRAMIATISPTAWESAPGAIDPNLVFLRDATGRREVPYTHPNLRALDRPLAGVRYNIVLEDGGASLRLHGGFVELELILPPDVDADKVLALVMFGDQPRCERKVRIGDDQHSFPAGVIAFREIPFAATAAPDQSGAPKGFVLYRVKPGSLLDRGEYALLLAKGKGDVNDEVSYGPYEGFNVYDFAVD